MKFITVRDLRTRPAKIWAELPSSGEMVITNNGKPIALLTPVEDKNLIESVNALKAVKAMTAVMRMQTTSIRKGGYRLTRNEIEKEIKIARSFLKRKGVRD
jgi:antitoxin (DNA-binding transcriptional repressor) of toxin-antitoxin stability system